MAFVLLTSSPTAYAIITQPTNGAVVSGCISISESGPCIFFHYFQYRSATGSLPKSFGGFGSSPRTVEWDTTTVPDGRYEIRSGCLLKVFDTIIVRVCNDNNPPVADAGPDMIVEEGSTVTLNGSGSYDADLDDSITYNWISGLKIRLNNPRSVRPTFTALEQDACRTSRHTFILEVEDESGSTDTDKVTVEVVDVNTAPAADAGPDMIVEEGTVVVLNGSGSRDTDQGDMIAYNWTAPEGIGLDDARSARPTFAAPEQNACRSTEYVFMLEVEDGCGSADTDLVTVEIVDVNTAPAADAGPDMIVEEGRVVVLNGSGSRDTDQNDSIAYNWTAPEGIWLDDAISSRPTFTAPEQDACRSTEYVFMLEVEDGCGSADTDLVTVEIVDVNTAPASDAGPDMIVEEGRVVVLNGSGSRDTDQNDSIAYNWTAPEGIGLDDARSARPTFTAPEQNACRSTEYVFMLEVEDGCGSADTDNVTVEVVDVNTAPASDAGPDMIVEVGAVVVLNGSGSRDTDQGDDHGLLKSIG
ncbi:MAG: hypothetical protein U9N48_02085 [Euryarchaeota archaeon]|nr:hypothetical protein [Euryarchaeota archaeon]